MLRHAPLRNALLVAALTFGGLFASTAEAREATVVLKDGTRMTGELIGDDQEMVTLLIAGIRTPMSRERIKEVLYQQTIPEQFRERRARIADDNAEERAKLIRWLIDNKAWDLAGPELKDFQKRFPDDRTGKLLERLMLENKPKDGEGSKTTPAVKPEKPEKPEKTDKPEKPTKSGTDKADRETLLELLGKRLNEDQINMIRVYEIDPQTKPVVVIPRETIDDLFKNYSDSDAVPKGKADQDRFRGLNGYDQIKVFFAARARDLYPKIKVKSDPEPIRTFRERVHANYVINYCGTNECHGGMNAGNFFVFNQEPLNAEPTVYTNFYTLHHYENARGYMLNFEKPDSSYLLQFGLPVTVAKTPHPQVKGWRATFNNTNDARYRMIVQWMTMFPAAKADYGIVWTSPVEGRSKPTSQPAEETPVAAAPAAVPAPAPAK